MAQVTLRINGYAYTVGCGDGEEAHLQQMAGEVESRIDSIKALGPQSGEARLLVLAALLLADELHDLRALGPGAQPAPPAARDPGLAERLARLAQRAEEIAETLDRA